MNFKEIELNIEASVATITLNNPQKLNPFTIPMGQELVRAFYECEYNDAVKAVILIGAGKGFSSGGDIQGMASYPDDRKAVFFKDIVRELNSVITAIRRLPKPVLAAVNGVASGAGFSLALACDLAYAAKGVKFNLAHVNVGLHPDGGATYFLPRLIGVHKTRELVFTARFITAEEALQLNIINAVFAADKLMEEVAGIAKKLASGPSMAIALAKGSIDRSLEVSLTEQLEIERQAIAITGASEDLLEGVKAFMEKRPPKFTGK